MIVKVNAVSKNGLPVSTKEQKRIKEQINYWKAQINKRKCKEFSKMSYWEIVSTNNAQ